MADIAGRMAEVRTRLGLTQKDMADRLGIPYRTLQDGERGIAQPGASTLAAYADHGVDLNWLVTGHAQEHLPQEQAPSPDDQPSALDSSVLPREDLTPAITQLVGRGLGHYFSMEAVIAGLRHAVDGTGLVEFDRSRVQQTITYWDSLSASPVVHISGT